MVRWDFETAVAQSDQNVQPVYHTSRLASLLDPSRHQGHCDMITTKPELEGLGAEQHKAILQETPDSDRPCANTYPTARQDQKPAKENTQIRTRDTQHKASTSASTADASADAAVESRVWCSACGSERLFRLAFASALLSKTCWRAPLWARAFPAKWQ